MTDPLLLMACHSMEHLILGQIDDVLETVLRAWKPANASDIECVILQIRRARARIAAMRSGAILAPEEVEMLEDALKQVGINLPPIDPKKAN